MYTALVLLSLFGLFYIMVEAMLIIVGSVIRAIRDDRNE